MNLDKPEEFKKIDAMEVGQALALFPTGSMHKINW